MILAFEGFAAELAGEASLVAMRQLVLGQRRCTGKHLGTHLLSVKSKPTRRGGGGGGGGRRREERERERKKTKKKRRKRQMLDDLMVQFFIQGACISLGIILCWFLMRSIDVVKVNGGRSFPVRPIEGHPEPAR